MRFRNLYYICLRLSSFLFRKYYRNRLKVLAYHDIKDIEIFRTQLKYLKKKYNLIDLSSLEDFVNEKKALPENSLLITFDDGDFSVLEKGLIVLSEENVPAVLFIVTGLIDTNKDFWWSLVKDSMEHENYSNKEIQEEIRYLKNVSNQKRLKFLESIQSKSVRQLSKADLEVLNRNNIAIANHSHTHPMFDKCTKDELNREFQKSYKFFSNLGFGKKEVFAYPNGNFDISSEITLKKYGVNIAFLFDHKINRKDFDPLKISRIRVDSNFEINEFISKVSGIHPFLFNLK